MHLCGQFIPRALTRREMLFKCANGFGGLALLALLAEKSSGALSKTGRNPLAPRPPHFGAKARSVIFLYMDGGPSQVDTFDPKPLLAKENGQPFKMKMEPTQFNNNGSTLGALWEFKQYGKSGIPVSSLFPHTAQCVDDLAVIRSMTSNFSEHTNANYFLHTGSGLQGRPSMGAWVGYGLGSESENLPGFRISQKTDYRVGAIVPWVAGEKYLFGQIVDMGGVQKANIHLKLDRGGKTIIIGTSQGYLHEQTPKIYHKALLHVRAQQHHQTGELRNVHLIALVDYNPTYNEEALDRFAATGEKAWADVADASNWVKELRGG